MVHYYFVQVVVIEVKRSIVHFMIINKRTFYINNSFSDSFQNYAALYEVALIEPTLQKKSAK